jgi:type IV pilus assembly protein PilQ
MRVDSRKFLPAGVLLVISTLAVHGTTSKEGTIIKDVSVSNSGDSLEAKITTDEPSKYTYFELKKPHRLVVDFHGIQNTISFKEKRIGAAGVERVRTSFYSDRRRKATRIVFDLDQDAPYRVIEDGGGVVRIVFGDIARAPGNLTAGPVMIPVPVSYPLIRATSPALKLASLLPAPEPPALPLAPAETSAIPQVEVSSAAAVPSTLLAAEASGGAQQTQITIVPPSPPQVPTTATPIPQYQGELISMDIKDYDIKDFFRLISEISGLNVVLDPNITGTVTLKLTDVPWDQALDVVLKNYQLGGQLQGNVLRIATNTTLQGEQAAQKALRDAQELATPLVTRTFQLNYTKADAVSTILGRLLTTRGTIIQDPRRNALIISDIPSQFGNLDTMVKFLDAPARQVEIEARLLQANKSFSRDIGNQLGLLIGNRTGNVLTGLPNNSSPFTRTPPPRATTGASLPLVANFPVAATSGLAFLIQPGGDIILDEIIGAAEARGTAKLISRPKVMTQNNVPATIQQTTQIPVQTNVNNTITVQFQSFGLNLNVNPQITEAGTILLQVTITNQQPDFARAVNGVPSVASQSATTQVLVPDGGTAVIGGILVDQDTINIRQVPGLGNLPVIGTLFKATNTAKSTAELIFFITPRIKALDAISVLAPGEGTITQP